MSKKAKQYSAIEKSKIVIEAIKGELTIAQISSKYGPTIKGGRLGRSKSRRNKIRVDNRK